VAADFSDDLRRRPRLKLAAGVSCAAVILLGGLGALSESRSAVGLAGLACFVASLCVYRLQADGWVAPSARIELYEGDAADNQARAPGVLVLLGIGALIVAYSMH
jgi:hypothetical protein